MKNKIDLGDGLVAEVTVHETPEEFFNSMSEDSFNQFLKQALANPDFIDFSNRGKITEEAEEYTDENKEVDMSQFKVNDNVVVSQQPNCPLFVISEIDGRNIRLKYNTVVGRTVDAEWFDASIILKPTQEQINNYKTYPKQIFSEAKSNEKGKR